MQRILPRRNRKGPVRIARSRAKTGVQRGHSTSLDLTVSRIERVHAFRQVAPSPIEAMQGIPLKVVGLDPRRDASNHRVCSDNHTDDSRHEEATLAAFATQSPQLYDFGFEAGNSLGEGHRRIAVHLLNLGAPGARGKL